MPAFFFHVLPLAGLNDIRSLESLRDYLRKTDPFQGAVGWPRCYNADGYSMDNGDVHFRGERARVYTNREPIVITVDGTCPVA
jgi:hypothetical protein